ncbi:hypothetical protein PCANC_14697 [Puccinia coronata f. sp. avenae]|uniref:Uncharacterized protein n=1 Tax=Puccinia coronata f. sp. avenae TaxID=200324 RepID=A0A2N5UCK6_9BASI|nr:hypothetical protein PCANC_14697 [Puccinia coronata f. sp. avenae]PLW40505.1 hypothetical protein PCASD_08837 [Puccinia coronata f. sp. avenae]
MTILFKERWQQRTDHSYYLMGVELGWRMYYTARASTSMLILATSFTKLLLATGNIRRTGYVSRPA